MTETEMIGVRRVQSSLKRCSDVARYDEVRVGLIKTNSVGLSLQAKGTECRSIGLCGADGVGHIIRDTAQRA